MCLRRTQSSTSASPDSNFVTTRYLSLAEVLDLYDRIIRVGGGSSASRDLGALESALAQPRATFGEQELYPSLVDKASPAFTACHAKLQRAARRDERLPWRSDVPVRTLRLALSALPNGLGGESR